VLAESRDDGWTFKSSSAETIREHDAYSGVRVTVSASLASALVTFHVDVNVGDIVWPPAASVLVPRLLGGQITVRGYSLSMILAEKLVTAVQRGLANTRWRDFADIYVVSGRHVLHADVVRESIRRVATHRAAVLSPLSDILPGFGELAANKWSAWVRKHRLADRLPPSFSTALVDIRKFADPLLRPGPPGSIWDPTMREWSAEDGSTR
jgi:hypothetical protein